MTNDNEKHHQLVVRTAVLDQIVKSLMQSITANTAKRRRLATDSKQGNAAARESELLNEAFTLATAAQAESFQP